MTDPVAQLIGVIKLKNVSSAKLELGRANTMSICTRIYRFEFYREGDTSPKCTGKHVADCTRNEVYPSIQLEIKLKGSRKKYLATLPKIRFNSLATKT